MKQIIGLGLGICLIYLLIKAVFGPTCSEARAKLAANERLQQKLMNEGTAGQRYVLATEETRKSREQVRKVCNE